MIIKNAEANQVASISAEIACAHCRLPVPSGLIDHAQSAQFCCRGCATAYSIIQENGLEAFYDLMEATTDQPIQPISDKQSIQLAEFDDEAFQRKNVQHSNGTGRVTLALQGLHCAACIWLIEKLPQLLPGVIQATVNWSRQTVTLVWHWEEIKLSAIGLMLQRLGYSPRPVHAMNRQAERQRANRGHLIRIGVAGAAAGNNMLIAISLYLGMFSYMTADIVTLLRVASCLVGLISLLGPGIVFFHSALIALRTRTPHMDLPIALALAVGGAVGVINTITGVGEIYFDSLSILVFLLLIGRWIRFRQQNRASDAVEMLYRLTPSRARKLVNGVPIEVSVESLLRGDLIEIRPGDLLPVDGIVIDGESHVDEMILSGESQPVTKYKGDLVAAGTKNLSGHFVVTASEIGNNTRLSRLAQMVDEASATRPPIVEWANRIGGYFVMIVIALSFVTLAIWMRIDPASAVDHMVALLVVTCPCALAMATPLAISVTLGRLARRRILVKSGDVVQRLNRAGMIWLDKTGTITEGHLQVVKWFGEQSVIPQVAAIESRFSHPIALAFNNLVPAHEQPRGDVQQTFLQSGGICGRVGDSRLVIGNRQLMLAQGIKLLERHERAADQMLRDHLSPCFIAVDDRLAAVVGLGDRIRGDAKQTIDRLKSQGWQVGILSGDHQHIVDQVSRSVAIEPTQAFGGLSPEQKLDVINQSNSAFQTVVMVGDGINDSAALAAATVGIAVHEGAEVSLSAAPVYIGKPGLGAIVDLIESSRKTCRTIITTFIISLTYNLIGVILSMTGYMEPLLAAILMPISSLTVIGISLRGSVANHEGFTDDGDGCDPLQNVSS
ncbi:MAG TPA: heavy metal translocating P-type ATPase [Pirellulaceae bacterium]|nr:heavy metal translocating P-type ATPase [Pirellulaceae bacterium]HMO92680.1 heavy metal translocating P-type ATPase [Pirellulaceae bacterium]HMP70572.1 heavy metal translocating P-type ATPase [Pirellulaceae bacterium]